MPQIGLVLCFTRQFHKTVSSADNYVSSFIADIPLFAQRCDVVYNWCMCPLRCDRLRRRTLTDMPLYSYILSARGPDAPLATDTHSADCKWRTIYINLSPYRNSIKSITCSHRNNLTLDSAHYRDPCNVPAKGNRV